MLLLALLPLQLSWRRPVALRWCKGLSPPAIRANNIDQALGELTQGDHRVQPLQAAEHSEDAPTEVGLVLPAGLVTVEPQLGDRPGARFGVVAGQPFLAECLLDLYDMNHVGRYGSTLCPALRQGLSDRRQFNEML